MEFHEKLQELRKQKGLTQEELAEALYVSRTAVSKWESGRGYPNIDSLKAIAKYFSVTIDSLLSGDEVLNIAEEDRKENVQHTRDLVFGLLDCSTILFLFLPLFGQKSDGMIEAVSLLSLTGVAPYLRAAYFGAVIGMSLLGLLLLALQNWQWTPWQKHKHTLSMLFHVAGALLFINSAQTYVATVLFAFLVIKTFLLLKKL